MVSHSPLGAVADGSRKLSVTTGPGAVICPRTQGFPELVRPRRVVTLSPRQCAPTKDQTVKPPANKAADDLQAASRLPVDSPPANSPPVNSPLAQSPLPQPLPVIPLSIKHWPAADRPRERLMQSGPGHVSDAELLAVVLGRGVAGVSALDLARQLLHRFGGMRGVLNAPPAALEALHGLGPGKSSVLTAVRECCCRYMGEKLMTGRAITSPADSQDFLIARLRDRPHEVFCCVFLDNRHRVLAFEELFRGTIDSTTVYPREVVRQALQRNAAALILAHNHPSGVPEPSEADRLITRRIRDALDLVDVRLLDHFVIGDGACVSLASRGLL